MSFILSLEKKKHSTNTNRQNTKTFEIKDNYQTCKSHAEKEIALLAK